MSVYILVSSAFQLTPNLAIGDIEEAEPVTRVMLYIEKEGEIGAEGFITDDDEYL